MELLNVDYKTLNGFFSALRSIGSTVDTTEVEHRHFMESLGHTEKMVQGLFSEAVSQQKFITAEHRDGLEQKLQLSSKPSQCRQRASTSSSPQPIHSSRS